MEKLTNREQYEPPRAELMIFDEKDHFFIASPGEGNPNDINW